jgi:hypothetical protein
MLNTTLISIDISISLNHIIVQLNLRNCTAKFLGHIRHPTTHDYLEALLSFGLKMVDSPCWAEAFLLNHMIHIIAIRPMAHQWWRVLGWGRPYYLQFV